MSKYVYTNRPNAILVFLLCFVMSLILRDVRGGSVLGDLTNALQNATGNKKNKKKKDESVGVPKAGFSIKYGGELAAPLWVEIVNHSEGRNLKYSWDFGDGSYNAEDDLQRNLKHQYKKPGTYTIKLVVKNSFGEDTATETLSIAAIKPNADFDVTFDSTSVYFVDKSSGGSIVKWRWDFGDGNTSDDRSPVYVYKKAGIYKVKLTVQNEFNLSSAREEERQLVVFPKFSDTTEVENTIEPFGNITWRDSLLDVVVKMNNIVGVENVCMSFEPGSEGEDGVSVKGIINKEGLIGKLSEGMSLIPTVRRDTEKETAAKIMGRTDIYTDINGRDARYLLPSHIGNDADTALVIRASPVIISSIPFELKVYFVYAPGLAIEKPGNVFSETRFGCSFPLLIDRVALESDSPRVAEEWGKIKELLHKKYGTLIKQTQLAKEKDKKGFHRSLSDWYVSAFDDFGNSLSAECKLSHCIISYGKNIDYYKKELAAVYQKQLIGIELKKYGHLPESIPSVVMIDKSTGGVERIMPFGGLSWDDGLFDIVTKLNNIKGINSVEIIKEHNSGRFESICDINNAMAKEDLAERLLGSIRHSSFKSSDIFVESYIDVNGKDAKYVGAGNDDYEMDLAIKATPISILGVPYSVVVRFRSMPGFILECPQKTLFSDSGRAFPFIITKVSLFENSPIVPCKKDVIEFCAAKYKELGATEYKGYGSKGFTYSTYKGSDDFDGRDTFGNYFSVTCRGGVREAKISYTRPEGSFTVFKEKYKEHIGLVELKRTKDKPNMNTDL